MEEAFEALRAAVAAWFTAASAGPVPAPSSSAAVDAISGIPAWGEVRARVAAVVNSDRRPDLYREVGPRSARKRELRLSDRELLMGSGLARAVYAGDQGLAYDADSVAQAFAAFCVAPMPVSEDWLLLDGEFPSGCCVQVGDFTLQTFTLAELQAIRPTGPLAAEAPFALSSALLDGAPFLHRAVEGRRPKTGLRLPLLHTRPEIKFCEPLIALSLWRSEPLHMNALFTVERGRQVLRASGDIPIEEQTSDGEDVWSRRATGRYEVTAEELPSFERFCARIGALVAGVSREVTVGKRPKEAPRARRLGRAGEHLVRAGHRTFGHDFVWDEETDETVLHHVIALEALLSDGKPGGELSRKVAQRAAALWLTDAHRLEVAKIVKEAYDLRSTYAHGSPTQLMSSANLNRLRQVTHHVLLRWLIVAPTDDSLGKHLDDSLLSEAKRRQFVEEPLVDFYTSTPPASLPGDVKETVG
ncbi:HEPN domain-containing protein [Streptomyces sp. Pv4-95]|uniref:hypothetical protein n=1 Tax=Streptomyces sp. Pv4-95 TaxID=3049543 RepID=UPI0038921DA4